MTRSEAIAATLPARSFWQRQRWLILRRMSQLLVLLCFLSGPWLGWWVARGNLSSSMTLEFLPLTDPLLALQIMLTGHLPAFSALLGAGLVLAFYLLVGGRVFCSWVCPVNAVTDSAAWLRRRLGLKGGRVPDVNTRQWALGGVLLASALTGTLVWEWINPVSLLHRSLIFGLGGGFGVVLGIFFYDLLLAPRGWCGHWCPMGAFYGQLGRVALLRVAAPRRAACDDCMDCYTVCPEPQVLRPALKGCGTDTPLILARDCTTCGRCIDVCDQQVFKMTHRFDQRSE